MDFLPKCPVGSNLLLIVVESFSFSTVVSKMYLFFDLRRVLGDVYLASSAQGSFVCISQLPSPEHEISCVLDVHSMAEWSDLASLTSSATCVPSLPLSLVHTQFFAFYLKFHNPVFLVSASFMFSKLPYTSTDFCSTPPVFFLILFPTGLDVDLLILKYSQY